MLIGKKANISVTIYTYEKNCRITEQESKSFNSQYGPLDIKFTDEFHDRFLLLDEKELYHVGASIKDAGKKAFENRCSSSALINKKGWHDELRFSRSIHSLSTVLCITILNNTM